MTIEGSKRTIYVDVKMNILIIGTKVIFDVVIGMASVGLDLASQCVVEFQPNYKS